MELDHTSETDQAEGKRVLRLGAVLLTQLVSNLVFPGIGVAFLGLLLPPGWFGTRAERIVIALGAFVSVADLAVALLDGVTGATVSYQFVN
ncbi:hypothetical protein HUN58_02015 [Curtobacterium sp. Csp1]|uniref:hypothetical protein n=1 Tax=Curtobacterium sp. Csp1 TaxID=2495429 RepID=UPI00159B47A0|nr:hypothetical protein [Curtobacterium sp. Csp1]QKS18838.1 hypothetical protein HUN58_02015 [Curtobacterium sp. Csp1]